MKSSLQDNDIKIYLTHIEEKCVVVEKDIRTLKNKTYKYLTSTLKNVWINILNDTADEYNNTYHRTIKMKP